MRTLVSPRVLLTLGFTILAGAGLAYLLGYRGGRAPTASPPPATTAPAPGPVPFAITSADATSAAAYSARVAWTTTEPAAARLQWGPAGVEPVLWSTARSLTTGHTLALSGLASSTVYTVTVTASSARGTSARTTFSFTTAAAPSTAKGSVGDGVLLIDGQPFLPLIAWQQCPQQWAASEAAGINLFAGAPCSGLAGLLQAIDGHALAAGSTGDSTTDAPGMLGWFYPDEADARGLSASSLPQLPPGLRFLTLSSHFAAGAAPLPHGASIYPGLVANADVVGFDLYPLQELCRRDLLTADFDAQRQLEALAPGKPTFQWIETAPMRCGERPGLTPSPATIRAESWLALAAGARGLAFFPPNWGSTAAPAIHGISQRIRQLEPALLRQPLSIQVEAGPTVRASARAYHGAIYIIAINGGERPAGIRLTVPGLSSRTVQVLGTTQRLDAHAGTLADTVQPLRVKIYVAAPAR